MMISTTDMAAKLQLTEVTPMAAMGRERHPIQHQRMPANRNGAPAVSPLPVPETSPKPANKENPPVRLRWAGSLLEVRLSRLLA